MGNVVSSSRAQWEHGIERFHLQAFGEEDPDRYRIEDGKESLRVVTQSDNEYDKSHNWGNDKGQSLSPEA